MIFAIRSQPSIWRLASVRKFFYSVSCEASEALTDELKLCKISTENNDFEKMKPLLSDYIDGRRKAASPELMSSVIVGLSKMSRMNYVKPFMENCIANGSKPSQHVLETLTGALLGYNMFRAACDWEASLLQNHGLIKDVGVTNQWLSFYLRLNNLHKAKELYESLKERNLTPDHGTFERFYLYFLNRCDIDGADHCKSAMLSSGITPQLSFYKSSGAVFMRKKMINEVKKMMQEMEERQIERDAEWYDVIMCGCAENGMIERLNELMVERNARPETQMTNNSYCKLIEAFGMNMTTDLFKQYYDGMMATGFSDSLNAFSYYSLIYAFIAQNRFEEVMELCGEMKRQNLVLPQQHYAKLMAASSKANFEYGFEHFVQEAKRQGITPGPEYYHVLLENYLKKGEQLKVDEMFVEMACNGVVIDEKMAIVIIKFLCSQSHYQRLSEFVDYLSDKQLNPHMVLTQGIHDAMHESLYIYSGTELGGILKKSAEIVDRNTDGDSMEVVFAGGGPSIADLEKRFNGFFKTIPFRPTVHVFNEIMLFCLTKNLFNDIVDVYNEMRRHNIEPDNFTFTMLIKSRVFMTQPEEAKKYLYEMKRFELEPSHYLFGLVIHCFCRLGCTGPAEALINDMKSVFHMQPNHVLYASLLFAHCRRFEYSAVFRTFESMEQSGLLPDTETSNYVLLSLFDVGEYEEALEFLEKMKSKGIKRNTYTYAILADRMITRDDYDGAINVLMDSKLDGNSIDAFAFNRILATLHMRMALDWLEKVVELAVDIGIRINGQIAEYVQLAVNRILSRVKDDNRPLEIRIKDAEKVQPIIEKSLIDFDEYESAGSMNIKSDLWESFEQLHTFHKQNDLKEHVDKLELFTQNLDTIRTLMLASLRYESISDQKKYNASIDLTVADLLSSTRAALENRPRFFN